MNINTILTLLMFRNNCYDLFDLVDFWPSVFNMMIILNVSPFDYIAFAVSGNVRIHGLTTPVWWLLLLQLIVLSRSAIVVISKFLVAFCVVTLIFWNVLLVQGFLSKD